MTSLIRALAGLERCERPTCALLSASDDQPGRFAHGPDEKWGRAGFIVGFMAIAYVKMSGNQQAFNCLLISLPCRSWREFKADFSVVKIEGQMGFERALGAFGYESVEQWCLAIGQECFNRFRVELFIQYDFAQAKAFGRFLGFEFR